MLIIKSEYSIDILVFWGETTYDILIWNNLLDKIWIFHKKS